MPMLRLLTLLNLTQISKQKKGQVGSTLDVRCQKPYSSTSHFGEVVSGEVTAPTTVITPSGEESVSLPLEANIPKECLPDVLDVYDKHASALLRITIPFYYHVHDKNSILIIPAGDPPRVALYRSWEKFVARCPVKFVRKYPGHVPTTDIPTTDTAKGEGPFHPCISIQSSHLTKRSQVTSRTHRPPRTTGAPLANSISVEKSDVSAPATIHMFALLHSPSRHMQGRPRCVETSLLKWPWHAGSTGTCSSMKQRFTTSFRANYRSPRHRRRQLYLNSLVTMSLPASQYTVIGVTTGTKKTQRESRKMSPSCYKSPSALSCC